MYFVAVESAAGTLMLSDALQVLGPHAGDRLGRLPARGIAWSELSTLADRPWDTSAVSPELILHAVSDALGSDLAQGQRPEEWSPLGNVDLARFGAWQATESLAEDATSRGRAYLLDASEDESPVLAFDVDGERAAVLSIHPDAFVVSMPVDAEALVVTFDDSDSPAPGASWRALEVALPDGEPDELILWRIYAGEHSWVRDALTRAM